MKCMHPEDSFVLVGKALVCGACRKRPPRTRALELGSDLRLPLPVAVPVLSDLEVEEVEVVSQVVSSRAARAACEGRREDAEAMQLALQTVRNLSRRMTPAGGIRIGS